MRSHLALELLVLALVAVSGAARASVELDPGVILQDGVTQLIVNATLLPNTLTFEPTTGAPVFNDSLVLDLEPVDGTSPYAWLLDNATSSNVTISGSSSVNGTFRLAGENFTTYVTQGVYFTAPFTFIGPTENFTIPAGLQTIVITPAAPIPNGSRLMLSSSYSPETRTIGNSVTLVDPQGNALAGIPVLLTVLQPDGTYLIASTMLETVVPGVYTDTHILPVGSPLGNYQTIASVGTFVGSQSIRVDEILNNILQNASAAANDAHLYLPGISTTVGNVDANQTKNAITNANAHQEDLAAMHATDFHLNLWDALIAFLVLIVFFAARAATSNRRNRP